MPDISIQFHGLPQEILPLVRKFVAEHQLCITALQLNPFAMASVSPEDLSSAFGSGSAYSRLALSLRPAFHAEEELGFMRANPDHLRLDIGRRLTQGLEQSWLSARTGDEACFALWKKLASRLRRLTHAGVTAINRDSGASAVIRSFRYTDGASKLEMQNVPMLPPQGPGGPLLRLGPTRRA